MIYDWLQHIEFANKWVLPFLGIIPVLIWLYYRNSRFIKSTLKVTTAQAFKTKTGRNTWLHFPFWLRLISVACLITALARPQIRDVKTRNKGEGIDIILCMDVSGSMLSQDFTPNRLTVARNMAVEFVKNRPVDRIGLVVFAGESFTQFPLSTDHEALVSQIRGITPGMLEDGTVIGEGLAKAVERLSGSRSKSRIIILLTDGNEQPPETRIIDPVTALEIARAKQVKVYTIGMGSIGVSTSPQNGNYRVPSNAFLDEGLLKRIAVQTGGAYFRAINAASLQDIYEQIDKLEKSPVEVVTKERFHDQFPVLLVAALLLLLLEVVLKYTLLRTFP
jgi:Ca-activated chloride channel family protein